MKNLLLLTLGVLPLAALAEVTTPPSNVEYKNGMYGIKLSASGEWIGSMAGDASMYNTVTGEYFDYWGSFLGIGKSVADNGIGVGDSTDHGVLLFNGETIFPPTLQKYWFCDVNGITADGSRICGTCSNEKVAEEKISYVPFIADIDENGEVGEVEILPYPTLDFFRAQPYYASAVNISDDGKTIIGQMVDWRGMYSVPIYYLQDEAGNWSYHLPTHQLFNPQGIEIPDNPWLAEPPFPEPENFMSATNRNLYQEIYDNWIASGCIGEMPDYVAFMTDEEYNTFAEAVTTYNDWYYSVEDNIKAYIKIYKEVLETTPSFDGNDAALSPDGEYFYLRGGEETPDGDIVPRMYQIFTGSNAYNTYQMPIGSLYPHQILDDGSVIFTKPMMSTPDSYIMNGGSHEIKKIEDWLFEEYPEIVEWIETNFPGGNGVVSVSRDCSTIVGALLPDHLADYGEDDWYYNTYIIKNISISGIENLIAEPENGVYTVYDLKGVKVMETKEASEVNALPKGIYVVNGKKVMTK